MQDLQGTQCRGLPMETLTALKDTFIKKSTAQSSQLPSTEKKFYKAGKTIDIEAAATVANGNLKITLGFGAGIWYILEKDWSPIVGNSIGDGSSNVPPQAVKIVAQFEGFVPHVYNDGVGVATIGYGTTTYPNGQPVRFGDPEIAQATAQQYLAHDLESTMKDLAASIPNWSEMNSNQTSALISFGYNLGAYFYGDPGFTSITTALRDHDWSDVPKVMLLYSDPGDSTVHPGLLRRRTAEGELFESQGPFAV
jgi:GH24 family phage-related lysozyme (muramidase)